PIGDPHRARSRVVEQLTGRLDHPAGVGCLSGVGRCGSSRYLSEQGLRRLHTREVNTQAKALRRNVAPAAACGNTTKASDRFAKRDCRHCHISQPQKLNPISMSVEERGDNRADQATVEDETTPEIEYLPWIRGVVFPVDDDE